MPYNLFRRTSVRSSESPPQPFRHGRLGQIITSILQSASRIACIHPIYTIICTAFAASIAYVCLLESSLFSQNISANHAIGRVDFDTLLAGSRKLYTGPSVDWVWISDGWENATVDQEVALVTLVFADSISTNSLPESKTIVPSNSSARLVPSSTNPLSPISYDRTLAFALPFFEAPSFLAASQEIPLPPKYPHARDADGSNLEEKKWLMHAVRNPGSQTWISWIYGLWIGVLDLIKNAETLDVGIMALGYFLMHLTFFSLYLSMKRMGSNIWLAATVLLSGFFAFLFGLVVTTSLGVPLNMILLSEGIPFLVVIIGFEKPIILTKAVIAASLDKRRRRGAPHAANGDTQHRFPNVKEAIQVAVQEQGVNIIRDYLVHIILLAFGALSGVQGGLPQFCFLGAWILFFDGVLLFTFYTAILTIKLEINRIKRHVALRKALEDDGISRRVAENVATSDDDARAQAEYLEDMAIFGMSTRGGIPRFKIGMVGVFVLFNVLNLFTVRLHNQSGTSFSILTSIVNQPPIDPYKVAGNGLNAIRSFAEAQGRSTLATVLVPIKYELEYPSVHYGPPRDSSKFHPLFGRVGGRFLDGILKSLEDPVVSKWVISLLAVSVVLNGYLFNAARWTIKEPMEPDVPPTEAEVMDTPQGQQIPEQNAQNGQTIPRAQPELVVHDPSPTEPAKADSDVSSGKKRTIEECELLLKAKQARLLEDEELIELALRGRLPGYALEKTLGDMTRAVKIRRAVVSRTRATRETSTFLENSNLPYLHYDYERVHGACCENVIGYMPLPLGVAGPLMIDGHNYFLPMATTEGVLVASASRGCKAINVGGGAVTVLTGDGMTRGPCVGFETLARAGAAKIWLDSDNGQRVMRDAFNSTSNFARLQHMKTSLAGTYLYIRFKTTTGDAMGMNMISKGVERALDVMRHDAGFDDMSIISLSGNFCTDKKPAAINWVDGRGKSVVAEAIIPRDVVDKVLKSEVNALVELNTSKNLIGSAMAGSLGGFNAHAANIVAAIFIATGQDPAQVVESSACITTMRNLNGALQIAVSMPSIEVGTIGGGTILEPQAAMLDLLGVRGPSSINPGDNARQLSRIIAAAVLAGELSLCSALAAGHLVKAHMSHNRSNAPSRAPTPAPGPVSPVGVAGTPATAGIVGRGGAWRR